MRRSALACCALLFATQALARVSGSVALLTDYRYRGISLSDDSSAAQIDLDWSAPDGWYAGAFASSVRLAPYYHDDAQGLGYAGYARRIDADWNWEAGAAYAGFSRHHQYDYPEAYLGLVSAPLQFRIHYAPRYFGQGPPVVYAELDGARALTDHWRLLGHIGVLRRNGGAVDGVSRHRYDARAGVGARIGAFDLQLAWVAAGGGKYYAFGYPSIRISRDNAVVLSVSRAW
ncbi:MAG: TorF family putative porin [Rhodanobacteraceae bacterium]